MGSQNNQVVAQMMLSIKEARSYALNSQYETAITFYNGLDAEIAQHVNGIPPSKPLRGQWEEFRIQLNQEKAICVDLQQELKALVNPVEAARRDRINVAGTNGNGNGDTSPRSYPQQQQQQPRRPPPHQDHNNMPYQPAEQRQQLPAPWGGGGAPDLGMGAGMPGVGMDFGMPGAAPSASSGGRNEVNYGDRDRFGPPKPQATPTRQTNGGGGGAPGTSAWSNAYNNTPAGQAPGGRVGNSPSTNNNAASPPPAGPQRAKTKPPLPKFGANNAAGGGGGGAPRVPSKGPSGNNNGNRNGAQRGAGGGATAGKQKYVPRPGDEELVAQIEADMSTGGGAVDWGDVAGHEDAKALLEEAVVFPVLMPDYYQGIRRPWRGVLMYGPPGTGKTMLAKAVASECGTTFFNMSPATLTAKYRGESEKLVRILFEMARHYAPSTIFIDEIDSLCGQRGESGEHEASRRAKSVLLTQMDGVGVDQSKIVMVLGATNHPWDIDEAMRRRLEQRIYIPLPEVKDIRELMTINTKNIKLDPDVDFDELAHLAYSNHYSAADLTNVVRDASMSNMRRFMAKQRDRKNMKENATEISRQVGEEPVVHADFVNAIRKLPSSVNMDQITRFEKWQAEFATNTA